MNPAELVSVLHFVPQFIAAPLLGVALVLCCIAYSRLRAGHE